MYKQISLAMFALTMLAVSGLSLIARDTEAASSCSGDGVYLYEDRDYQGRCIKLTGDVTNLASAAFDDIVSSVRIQGDWTATLYADPDYTGALSIFTSSDSDLSDNTIGVNRASSVRVYKGKLPAANRCDGGEGVYLYENINYQGYCVKLMRDFANLDAFDFNDATSSIRVVGAWTATLYENKNYGGTSSTFTSDDSDLRDDGINLNRTSSVRVQSNISAANRCNGSEGVYLFSDPNYQGRCVRLTDNTVDLRTLGFDDMTSSIRVLGSWTVTLYADLTFSGASSTFTGDDTDLSNDGIGNGHTTSVRVQRGVGAPGGLPAAYACDGSEGVYLYENPQFTGRCVRLTDYTPDLRIVGFDDTASSIRVIGAWTVTLFRDLSGTGASSTFTQDDADLSNDGIGNDQATSAQVQRPNAPQPQPQPQNNCDGSDGVYLYENPQFGGRCVRFTSDTPDLRALGFDDTISSVHIVGSWGVTLYRDLSFTGAATAFTSDAPEISGAPIGDNQATSAQVYRR